MKEEAACRIQARNEQSINIFHAVVFWVMATCNCVTNTMPPSSGQKNSMFPQDNGILSMKAAVGKPHEKTSLLIPRCRMKDDIKMEFGRACVQFLTTFNSALNTMYKWVHF